MNSELIIDLVIYWLCVEVAARQAAIEAGVQVVPGTPGPITNAKVYGIR